MIILSYISGITSDTKTFLHLILWLFINMLHRKGFSSSVCQTVAGAAQVSTILDYHQCCDMFKMCMLECSIKHHVKCIQIGSTATDTHKQPSGHNMKYPSQSYVS